MVECCDQGSWVEVIGAGLEWISVLRLGGLSGAWVGLVRGGVGLVRGGVGVVRGGVRV